MNGETTSRREVVEPATLATREVAAVAAPTLRERLYREDGLEFCRVVSRRVVLEFTRVVLDSETEEEATMTTELHRGDVVVILRDRGRRGTEEDG